MAQMVESDVPNFSGSWTLRTSENLDAFLKAEGWGYIMRKAAAAVGATQVIEQSDKSIKITVKNKKGEYTYEATFDGAEIEYTDNDKDVCKSKTVLSGDKKKIIETIIKGKDAKEMKTERYMENNEMRMKITNVKGGHYCIRIFKRKG